jgi:hypothetical protein
MQIVEHLGGVKSLGSRDARERIAEGAHALTKSLDLVLPTRRAFSTAAGEKGGREPRLGLGRKVVAR